MGWWRHRLSDVIIANMTELAQCSKMNVFRDIPRGDKTKDLPIPSAHDLIVSAVKRINRYFSVQNNGHDGLDVSTILLRLGLGDHANAIKTMLHDSEKVLLKKSGITREDVGGMNGKDGKSDRPKSGVRKKKSSEKLQKKVASPKKSISKKKSKSQAKDATAAKASAKASATASAKEAVAPTSNIDSGGLPAPSSDTRIDLVYSKGKDEQTSKVIVKTYPSLPNGFPSELPQGNEFDWLRVPENGELELLKSLLKIPEQKMNLIKVIAKETPRALKEAEQKAAGKKIRPKIQKKK